MLSVTTRAATPADAGASGFDDLLPDRWREGYNRRSVVATDQAGHVLGHCRGIDNAYHPGSRIAVIAIAADEQRGSASWSAVADALVEAQVGVSTLPLHLKVKAHELPLIDLCARHGGVLIQVMPPWRYVIDARMRTWAQTHRVTSDGLTADAAGDRRTAEMLDLYVEHYAAQHARWSPAADPATLRGLNAPDFVPGAARAFDPPVALSWSDPVGSLRKLWHGLRTTTGALRSPCTPLPTRGLQLVRTRKLASPRPLTAAPMATSCSSTPTPARTSRRQ